MTDGPHQLDVLRDPGILQDFFIPEYHLINSELIEAHRIHPEIGLSAKGNAQLARFCAERVVDLREGTPSDVADEDVGLTTSRCRRYGPGCQ